MTAARAPAVSALVLIALVSSSARAEGADSGRASAGAEHGDRLGREAPPLVLAPAQDGFRSVSPESMVVEPALPAAPGHNRLGVLFGLVGLPQPVGVSGLVKVHDLLGVGGGVGILPGPLGAALLGLAGVNDGQLSSWAVEGEARLFPFRGAFWLGGAVGRMSLSASGQSKGTPAAVEVTTLYASPRLGWLGVWGSGFTLGLDLGVQIPLAPEVHVAASSLQQSNLESVARALSALPLPTASVKVGFLL